MDEADSEPMALVWIESLDAARIPFEQYAELYRRSITLRARRLAQGLKCEDFSVDMMIACWPSLAQELEQERINSGRYLSETAISDCPRCFGSGMEVVPGKGAKVCQHEFVEPQEKSLDPEAIDAVVDVIQNARKEEPERPVPTSDIGMLNEAIIRGGNRERLFNAIDYVRAMRRKERE